MDGPEIDGARALREFVVGEPEHYSRVYLVDADGPGGAVLDAAGPKDAVLLPVAAPASNSAAAIFRYDGQLEEPGDEMFLGGCTVELHDYIAAAFVQLVGPSVVAIVDDQGWLALLDDVGIARRTGVFPSALLDPRVILANRAAIERPDEMQVPNAIRVRTDGALRVGMRGEVCGHLSTTTDLAAAAPRLAALRSSPSADEWRAEHPERGWLTRCLRATDLLKMLRGESGTVSISGFGWALVDDDRADAEPSPFHPFLVRTPQGFLLADVATRRRVSLSPLTAAVVEVSQTSSSEELAVERLVRRLAVTASDARRLRSEAMAAFRIHSDGACDETPAEMTVHP
ncbi:daptide biosynthesis RiPP recognition protein [Microbacterium sp. 1.5R]|uniref:daptide biosynthesis RiPP recognition protein n=1 Tax=Microbacterium sp. 1.5R TaxID=1916917 RepID=UPI0011A3F2F9|nr:daptide biosynthesis RiPP recognition protein [Microbacterium sp. 1.5R]